MKRWIPAALAIGIAGPLVLIALTEKTPVKPAEPAPSLAAAEPAPAAPTTEPPPAAEPPPAPEPARATGFDTLPDGSPVPELPAKAPVAVRLGVVLFEFDGAQPAPGQKLSTERSKEEARALAEGVLALAKEDFAKAVQKGDRGSVANAGSFQRGLLEPSVQYAVFTMDKDTVLGPIETPRGFWVVRRIQ